MKTPEYYYEVFAVRVLLRGRIVMKKHVLISEKNEEESAESIKQSFAALVRYNPELQGAEIEVASLNINVTRFKGFDVVKFSCKNHPDYMGGFCPMCGAQLFAIKIKNKTPY